MYWGSGVDLPDEDYDELIDEFVIDHVELAARRKGRAVSLQLPAEFVIVFEPVTHAAQFIDVKGEPTRERQNLSIDLRPRAYAQPDAGDAAGAAAPGARKPYRHARPAERLSSPTTRCTSCSASRRPFLTAKRLLTNQTFRDLYRTDTLDVDQRLKITSLTFLFTDLSGSTELYERVGDLVAFDLVQAHFQVLHEIVAAEAGAVVKTIGDAVMATFPTPDRAVAAALACAKRCASSTRRTRRRGPAPEDRRP